MCRLRLTFLNFIFLAALGPAFSVHGQVEQRWARVFDNGREDAGLGLVLDQAGNIHVLGQTLQASGFAFVTIKYAPDGSQLWLAKYAPSNSAFAQAITVDPAGNVYVTGSSQGQGSGSDFVTIKYNSAGNELWVRRLTTTGNSADFPSAIAVDSAGNVLVSGYSINLSSGYDYLTVKYDSNGNQLWTATYDGAAHADDYAVGVAVDAAGNAFVTGFSLNLRGDTDYATIKYSADGRQLWMANYDGPGQGDDYPAGVQLDAAGNVYVAGTSAGGATGDDFATIKYDSGGNQIWLARYNGPQNRPEFASCFAVSPGGNVYVSGAVLGVAADDFLTVGYDAQGRQLWQGFYNGGAGGEDAVNAIALDGNGNIYVTGVSASFGKDDLLVVKYDSAGNQLWAVRYNGPAQGRDLPQAIKVDSAGDVIVTGHSSTQNEESDLITVKFAQSATAGFPMITRQPSSQAVLEGSEVVFSVAASGAEPLSFQWRLNGVDIPGATQELLRIPAANAQTAGAYSVVVRNNAGAIGSSTATLRVERPVSLVTVPQTRTVLAGNDLILAVTADGSEPLSYQWFLDNQPIPGATGPVLTIPNASLAQEGQYRVEVRNAVSSVSTAPVRVTVVERVRITRQPRSQLIAAGRNLELEVEATGTEPLTYQWFFNGSPIPNATAARLIIPNVSQAASGNYFAVVSNIASSDTSGVAIATVLLPPGITQPPQNQVVSPGANAQFTVQASGSPPLSYQWQYNGVNLPGETSPTLLVTGIDAADSGNYSVIVANPVDTAHSASAQLVVPLPAIVLPDNFAARLNDTAVSFTGRGNNLGATKEPGEPNHAGKPGGSSVWYAWTAPGNGIVSFNTAGSGIDTVLGVYTGTAVSGLTLVVNDDDSGPFLTSKVRFNAVTGTQYNIAIDGLGGARGDIVLSWTFVQTPDQVPVILQDPVNQTVQPGGSATFSVTVQPQPNLTYQWFFGNTPIPGATSPVLNVVNVQAAAVGGYRVEVRNNSFTALSATAFLELGSAAGVVSEDKFEDIFSNETGGAALEQLSRPGKEAFASVAAGATGTQVMDNFGASTQQGEPNHGGVIGGSSRWFGLKAQSDGLMVVDTIGSSIDTVLAVYRGANLANLTLIDSDNDGAPDGVRSLVEFSANNGVNYSVAVDGVRGVQGKITLNWKLGVAPSITAGPSSQTVAAGANVTFTATATGNPAPEFQWQFHGTDLPGATSSSLQLNNVQAGDAGNYRVRVKNFAGSAVSAPATLTVNNPILFLQQPQSRTVLSGENVSLSVIATGTEPLRYQWRLNGGPLAGATNSTLNLTNLQSGGTYAVVATDATGSLTSSNALLTVNQRPQITVQPLSLSLNPGETANFSVTATGTGPLTFQWRFGGVNIPGATNNSLQIANPTGANAGAYSVVVQSPFGSVTSEDALLDLGAPRLSSPTIVNNNFQFRLAGRTGSSAVVQVSTNLLSWTSLSTNVLTTAGVLVTDPGAQTNAARFYRALLQP